MKKGLLYTLFAVSLMFMIAVVVSYNKTVVTEDSVEPVNSYIEEVDNDELETVEEGFIRPYSGEGITIVNNIYSYRDSSENQEKSITYYEGLYMQNTGISYGGKKEFDVLATRSGEVTEVLKDDLVGNSITIKHDDSTFSTYQSIKNIKVKEGDKVLQGDILATSSTSNVASELNNHLYFELVINGKTVNPEECYN